MSKPQQPQTRYKTTNWAEYNAALKVRGLLTIWLDKDMQWYVPASGKRGRQQTCTDAAIQFCLSIKSLFGLALCQRYSSVGDAPMLPELLEQIPLDEQIASVNTDGAYDTKDCHAAIAQRGAQAVILPRRNGKPWKESRQGAAVRNAALRACQRLGWGIWKKWSVYHRRSLVETKMHCFKRLGERVMARTFERQVTELHVPVAAMA